MARLTKPLASSLALAALALSSQSAQAQDLIVKYDQSQLLRLPRPVAEIIIGNPPIAEVTVPASHLLVVTDGENTDGVAPDTVARAIGQRPDAERPSIYFVAFDVDAKRFARVRDAGGLILSAANATELNTTLDTLLSDKILVEK